VQEDQNENQNVTVGPDEVLAPGESEPAGVDENTDYISQPAKVMRIGSMVKSLLDEARSAPLDEAGRARLREIYETSIHELSGALSPDLGTELSKMALPFSARPSRSCASLKPSWWDGSRASSTGSRRRCSPNRLPRPHSWRRCAIARSTPGPVNRAPARISDPRCPGWHDGTSLRIPSL